MGGGLSHSHNVSDQDFESELRALLKKDASKARRLIDIAKKIEKEEKEMAKKANSSTRAVCTWMLTAHTRSRSSIRILFVLVACPIKRTLTPTHTATM